MEKGKELPAGTTVAFSTGSYSDYSVGTFAKLLKPMNEGTWETMCNSATAAPSYDPKGIPYFDSSNAIEWLRANGFIEEIEYVELHLGDYSDRPSWDNA